MYVTARNTRLFFDVEGAGLAPDGAAMRQRPTVILLHGGPGSWDHSYLKPWFSRLADVAQVIWLDLRDHGRSQWGEPRDFTFEKCADEVRAFCDALAIERPIVLGHSMGGCVAILYGARHPGHAVGIVLLSSFARFDLPRLVEDVRRRASEVGENGDEIADIARRTYGPERASVTAEQWSRVFALFGPNIPTADELARRIMNRPLNEWALGAQLVSFDAMSELAKIACPVLVCTGELDPVTPPAAAREIVAAVQHRLARLEIVEGAGHFPWKDQPERLWKVLAQFVLETAQTAPASARI